MSGDHATAWAGCGITFKARTQVQKQRLAEAAAIRRRVWMVRIAPDGAVECQQFAGRGHVPFVEGWASNEKAARRIAARLLPAPRPIDLPAMILLPAPPRYNRDKPRCGAKTRKGVPCQAQGLGRGGRCRNHGGMSVGSRARHRVRIHLW
jgi:hypothetical protein